MNPNEVKSLISALIVITVTVGGLMLGIPKYNAWRAKVAGQAELMKAEYTKRVLIETARAEYEAAELQASAIAIVGQAAKDFPEYRHQQFIQMYGEALQNGHVQMIFVPTEANIPLIMKP